MAQHLAIDLNADMGESTELLASGADAELMKYITSANIACGGHAGDAETMRATLLLAKANGVAAGAHPSYPDRDNFGRTAMEMPVEALERCVYEQLAALAAIAAEVGVALMHVKPHGALYHACNQSEDVARALARASLRCSPKLLLVGQANSCALQWWRESGAQVAGEAFADRAYETDGTLRKRGLPGAVLASADLAVSQALSIARDHCVRSIGGIEIAVEANTICLHSDTPGAADFARKVRSALERAGVRVCGLVTPLQ
ncbi:MAG TPA: 5-oxoprolinase subunit PxpA [candidate division Zixibacteria bacterium]|nr:5-oxoprolinase subunit PxpA [candidate division Zixibacteria bacterium]